jgi:CheY-like chemotaxis protein
MRLLFVNDDEFLSMGYKTQLSPYFTMYFAANGQQAIEKVSQNANDFFDVIFMDINMPVMDGFQAMKVISKQFQKLCFHFGSKINFNRSFNTITDNQG